jgi:4-alpha-glucanotransferase
MINVKDKLTGLLVPVFALRREQDQGIGDTTAVIEAIDFCARNNIGVLQVLPINETGGDNSPYNAISSVALDAVLLDLSPHLVPGLTEETYKRIANDQLRKQLQSGSVDYPRVKRLKLDLLKAGFKKFHAEHLAVGSPLGKEMVAFQEEQSAWLPAYTLFRTIMNLKHGDACWTRWESFVQNFKSAEKWLSESPERERLMMTRQFLSYIQWIAFKQWKMVRDHADKNSVQLMGDIPFGVSRYSADVWANPDLFDLEWSGGAPPETLFQDDVFTAKWGQNWGLPLYNWDAHRKQKFAWWKQRINKATEIFHYFRIDHVLGFFRIYSFPWVPERNYEFVNLTLEEAKERAGGRIPQFLQGDDQSEESREINAAQGEELLSMVLDAAGDYGVIAEDLGQVPDYVRPLLTKMGIPGFSIPYWEHEEDRSLVPKEELPALSLATYATHDHMPLVVFYEDLCKRWHGPEGHEAWLDVQRLMKFIGLDENNPPTEFTEELHLALVKALLESNCWLAVFMITDLLGTSERFNMPGTASDSNWSRRLDHTLSEFEQTTPYKQRIEEFSRLVKTTNRLMQGRKVGTIK